MNDKEKIITEGGMVFKKKAKDENAGEKKQIGRASCRERV